MTAVTPGFRLTRQWADDRDGLRLDFWLSTAEGPMAVSIVWGVSVATFLTLLLGPALYCIVDDLKGGVGLRDGLGDDRELLDLSVDELLLRFDQFRCERPQAAENIDDHEDKYINFTMGDKWHFNLFLILVQKLGSIILQQLFVSNKVSIFIS